MKHSEINLLYVSVFIRRIGASLISVFVPIFLLEQGFSIPHIIFYFLLGSLFFVLSIPWVSKIIARFGEKHALLFSIPFEIVHYLTLNYIEGFNIFFYISSITIGFYMAFFNTSYNLFFSHKSHAKQRGTEIARMGIFVMIAGVVSPYVGGVLAHVNFSLLFIISSIFIVLSALPLFFIKEFYEKIHFTSRRLFQYIFSKENTGNLISFAAFGGESIINLIIWPLFIMITLGDLEETGFVVSLTTMISIGAFYLTGKITDKIQHRKLIKTGTYLHSIGWIIRIFASTTYLIIIIDSLKSVSQKILQIPWTAEIYGQSKVSPDFFEFMVARETIFHITRFCVYLFLILIFYINFHPFIISILLAAIINLGYPYIQKTTILKG